jgi:hypothetical protein
VRSGLQTINAVLIPSLWVFQSNLLWGQEPLEAKTDMLYRSIKPLLVEAVQAKEPTDVPTEGGVVHVNPGDWLLRDPQGNLVRCDDVNFKCTYEPLEGSARLEEFREGKPCGC